MPEETPTTDDGSDLDVAQPEDFFVSRSDGETPDPVKQRIPGTHEALRVRPLTNGQLDAWGDELESDDPDPEIIAECFNYALADLDRTVTPEDVERGMIGYGTMPVLQAIKNASGYQAFLGFRKQQMELVGMLNQLDEDSMGVLEGLAEQNGKRTDDTS